MTQPAPTIADLCSDIKIVQTSIQEIIDAFRSNYPGCKVNIVTENHRTVYPDGQIELVQIILTEAAYYEGVRLD